jgi:hypothetical protein
MFFLHVPFVLVFPLRIFFQVYLCVRNRSVKGISMVSTFLGFIAGMAGALGMCHMSSFYNRMLTHGFVFLFLNDVMDRMPIGDTEACHNKVDFFSNIGELDVYIFVMDVVSSCASVIFENQIA